MIMRLIVDGYNLARSGTIFLENDPLGEEGRGELCALVSSYARRRNFRPTVVFDGRGAGRRERTRRPFKGGMAVYAASSETADDVIRDLVREFPEEAVVVTSDRGLAGTLPSRRATVVSCEDFSARLMDHRMEELKGAADGDEADRRPAKKGEGHRAGKAERRRERLIKKL